MASNEPTDEPRSPGQQAKAGEQTPQPQATAPSRDDAGVAQLAESIPLPVFVIDRDHVVTHWNRACEELTGVPAEHVVGTRRHWRAFHEAERPLMADLVVDGRPQSDVAERYGDGYRPSRTIPGAHEAEQFYPKLGDRGKWILLAAAPLWTEGGQIAGAVQTLQDVSERHSAVQELRYANQRILRQQETRLEEERLEVLLLMAGATAHELNQPLTALLGHSELLMAAENLPHDLHESLEGIVESAERIRDIVSHIQHIHRYQTRPYVGAETIIQFDQDYRVLIVDAQGDAADSPAALLAAHRDTFFITHVATGAAAEHALREGKWDLVIAEHMLPDDRSTELLESLRGTVFLPPIILIASRGLEAAAIEEADAGVSDCLPKEELTAEALLRSISSALERARLEGSIRAAQTKLTQLATRDDLTGLFNRRYILQTLDHEIARARRYSLPLSLCLLRVEGLARVYGEHGPAVRDQLLERVSEALPKALRGSDICGRYSLEAFLIILTNTSLDNAADLAGRLPSQVGQASVPAFDATQVSATCHVGVVELTEDVTDSFALVRLVEEAASAAKRDGPDRTPTPDASPS